MLPAPDAAGGRSNSSADIPSPNLIPTRGVWSRHSDLNRGPAVYETAALPLSYVGDDQGIADDFRQQWSLRSSRDRKTNCVLHHLAERGSARSRRWPRQGPYPDVRSGVLRLTDRRQGHRSPAGFLIRVWSGVAPRSGSATSSARARSRHHARGLISFRKRVRSFGDGPVEMAFLDGRERGRTGRSCRGRPTGAPQTRNRSSRR